MYVCMYVGESCDVRKSYLAEEIATNMNRSVESESKICNIYVCEDKFELAKTKTKNFNTSNVNRK